MPEAVSEVMTSARTLVLADPRCSGASLAGAKAAALAVAASAGLPVLDAVVLTTAFTAEIDHGGQIAGHPALAKVLEHFDATQALVVRSSSTAEDLAGSSMAGRFESVLDVLGADQLATAVQVVFDSRRRASQGSDLAPNHPIAVLVQPFVAAKMGGVLFGVDPITGRSDRLVVVAGANPDEVVSGSVDGIRNELDLDGNRTDDGAPDLPSHLRRELAALARSTADTFGAPQDVEWLVDDAGTLWLLQSRPVTTEIRGIPTGPLYGPGPVAETFPELLRPLERDLWVTPLRTAMREALVLAGAATREQLADRPVVVDPGGRVAVDLEITGEITPDPTSLLARLDPRPAVARVRTAWRIGRLRAALPDLALDVIDRTDKELRGMVHVADLTDRQLVALVERLQRALVSLHAHEILLGLVVDPDAPEITGASIALRVLGEARRDGRDDQSIIEDNPVVLALVAPRIADVPLLPQTPDHLPPSQRPRQQAGVAGLRREALRLRVRWVQELSARAAWEIGKRMVTSDQLDDPAVVAYIPLDELRMTFLRWAPVTPVVRAIPEPDPLPGTFRFSDTGVPIPVRRPGVRDESIGAGGGTGAGLVTHDTDDPPPGSVLVVSTLRPGLAPILGRLAGLIAETGNPLAHLAILAREADVATVVGVDSALDRYPEGTRVQLDGTTGQITLARAPTDRQEMAP